MQCKVSMYQDMIYIQSIPTKRQYVYKYMLIEYVPSQEALMKPIPRKSDKTQNKIK